MRSQRQPQFGGVRGELSMALGLTLSVGAVRGGQMLGSRSPVERAGRRAEEWLD